MQRNWLIVVIILVVIAPLAEAVGKRATPPGCLSVALMSEITFDARLLHLSDLLPPGAPVLIHQHAEAIAVGFGPLRGSLRVIDGTTVRRWIKDDALLDRSLTIPDRIYIHGASAGRNLK